MDLVARLVPKLLPHEKERVLRDGIAQAAAWGLTGVHQAGIDAEELEILRGALEAVPRLRVYAALDMEREPTPDALARQEELRRRFSGDRLRVGAVKGYVDGVVEAKTAAMFEPYPGGGTGLPNWTQEELDRTVAAYDQAGWQVMLHAIGDRGIDMALTAYERAARANGTSGRRHRVEHIEVARTADLPRFKASGVIASTQAMFPYPNQNHLGVYVPTLGPERARRAMAFKAIDDAGAVHGQQHVEGRAHGLAVVDHEDGALAQAGFESLFPPVLHGLGCAVAGMRCNATHSLCFRDQTVRLATAGEIVEARRAGCSAAARPISQIASTPPTR